MNDHPRIARPSDVPALAKLIEISSRALLKGTYSEEQIEEALGPVFGVDEQMISDGTYFVVERDSLIVACGGWSFREALYGGRSSDEGPARCLKPKYDAARIRAFFVHPAYVGQGIGSSIMRCCEGSILKRGFSRGEIAATLVGEQLYLRFGYFTQEYDEISLNECAPLKSARMTKSYLTQVVRSQFSIRDTKYEELQQISELELDKGQGFVIPLSLGDHQIEFSKPNVHYRSVLNDGVLIGFFILVTQSGSRSVEFRRILVSRPGLGIGTEIIRMLDGICEKELGGDRVWLDVFQDNKRARHIYESCGYQQFGQSKHEGRVLSLYEKFIRM